MITNKIKAIFQFIEFLHSNIENFKKFDEIMEKLYLLDEEKSKLNPRKNFADKLKYDEVQVEIKDKFKVIKDNIIQPIQAKVIELNLCNLNEPETLWNWNISEIYKLQDNFSIDTVPEILQQNAKYIEFRAKTNYTYFQGFFFQYLHEILTVLFDYFKETEQNEFENDLTLKSLIDELSQKHTITEKLNYWLEIKDNFKDFYPQRTFLSIPDSIYKIHFEMYKNDAEFTYWLLKYNANSSFDTLKKVRNIDKGLDSSLAKDRIELELKEINEFEERAKENLKAKKFDIYEYHYHSQYQDEIEYLRIIDNYYEKKGQRNPLSIDDAQSYSKQVMAYATHVLLKNFLETKLKELEKPAAPESIKIEVVEEKKALETKIREKTNFMLTIDPRKHEQILSESDYKKLVSWLMYYFENQFTVPTITEPIKKINTAKGNIIYTFISLFDDIHTGTRPKSLFDLIQKCFYQYRNDKIKSIEKSTKKPQFYDLLIKKTN